MGKDIEQKKKYSKRINTKYNGIFYRETITNNKSDKTYYIRYKDYCNKDKEIKIGKYSEGIRENYCNQKRNEIISKIRLGEEAPAAVRNKKKEILIISKFANEYFENRKDTRSKATDLSAYNKHILPFFEKYDFEQIDRHVINKYIKYLHTKTKENEKKVHLSDKTLNNILNLLKTISRYGLKYEFSKNDFTKYIELFDIDNARERFLNVNEIAILLEHSKNDELLYLIYKLALKTGARLSTILNISKKDIDFTNKLITLKDFKNNTTYKTFLTNDIIELLKNKVKTLKVNEKLFKSNPQRRLRALLDKLFNEDIDDNDRKNKIVFHSLRHTFASHLAINGTPIFTIQKLMNHKDIKMTMRYAKLADVNGRDAIEKLDYN